MKPQASEEMALNDASLLLQYAAESPKILPESIMMPIALAWEAREENAWNPDVSSKFWIAYSALCDLLKPVTLETIAAGQPVKSRRWLFFGAVVETTLAEKTERRYRILLSLLLATAIIFGYVATTATKINYEINDFKTGADAAALAASAAIVIIKSDLDRITPPVDGDTLKLSLDDPWISADPKRKITSLQETMQDMTTRPT
jgi:hypothetical protein